MFAGVECGARVLFAGPEDGADGVGGGEQLRQGLGGLQAGGAEHRGGVHQAGQGGEEDRQLGLVHHLGQARVLTQVPGRAEQREDGAVTVHQVAAAAVVDVRGRRADHRGGDHDAAGEEARVVAGRPGGGLARAVGGVGAEVDEGPAGERAGGGAEDVVHRRVVGEAEDDEAARPHRLGRGRGEGRPVGDEAGGP